MVKCIVPFKPGISKLIIQKHFLLFKYIPWFRTKNYQVTLLNLIYFYIYNLSAYKIYFCIIVTTAVYEIIYSICENNTKLSGSEMHQVQWMIISIMDASAAFCFNSVYVTNILTDSLILKQHFSKHPTQRSNFS